MSDPQIVECPADGCDYTGVPQSVAGHAQGSKGNHRGMKYTDIIERFSGDGDNDEQAEPEPQSTPEPSEPDTEQSTAGSGVNPVHETPDVESDSQAGSTGTQDTVTTCPDCDGELIDYRSHDTDPEGGFRTPDDYYCSECGQGWNE
jgi:hypothetical protein